VVNRKKQHWFSALKVGLQAWHRLEQIFPCFVLNLDVYKLFWEEEEGK
jgi:hypothetical protein